MERPTLLVGSFPYSDARETFSVSGPALNGVAKRLTDGEAQGWTMFAARSIPDADGIERDASFLDLPNRRVLKYRVRDGAVKSDIRFAPAGYEQIVSSSYAVFRELREQGVIAAGTRLQQSLPTPLGVVAQHFNAHDVPAVLDQFQSAHFSDVERLLGIVPHRDLALQWDVAVEIVEVVEGRSEFLAAHFPMEALAGRIAAAIDIVPVEVEVGIHLCYGNPGGRHIMEPHDLRKVVDLTNVVLQHVHRPLSWVHMPVPIERSDDAYFAALRDLAITGQTELYLGLVHLRDGIEGGRRRIAAAKEARSAFGIGTECGFRYVDREDVPALLELHRELGQVF
jgi:hypothetical protein